ncbi:MAG: sulfatase family protein [Acidobacteriota bacterium]
MHSSTAVLAILAILPVLACTEAETAAGRPNLVLIIADDLAWDDLGAYGHPDIQTPNLDRLAQEGMRFDQAFVTTSSCSPSRSSIITGRYPHGTDAEQLHWPLPAEQSTFVEMLRQGGYWTAAAGKWHLGDEVRDRFDEIRDAGASGFQLPAGQEALKGQVEQPASRDARSGATQWVPLLRDRPRERPFFLWLASFDPHRGYDENIISQPHGVEDAVVPPYLPDVPDTRKDLALYYDEVSRLDAFVGQVLAELERQGEADNTFVLFISDNGRPFPRAKTTLYDSGIKTPWIVRWPQKVNPDSVCPSLVSTVDIAPTFLELAGIEQSPTFQGESFLPLLENPEASVRDYVFAERHWHDYEAHERAVRSPRYKYIRNYYTDLASTPPADAVRSPTFQVMQRLHASGELTPEQMAPFISPRPEEEFYDLQADPHELVNLAQDPQYSDRLDQMRQALEDWQKTTGDTLPAMRTPDEFDRHTGQPLPNRLRPRPSKKQMLE